MKPNRLDQMSWATDDIHGDEPSGALQAIDKFFGKRVLSWTDAEVSGDPVRYRVFQEDIESRQLKIFDSGPRGSVVFVTSSYALLRDRSSNYTMLFKK
jgi:hypothetical protein